MRPFMDHKRLTEKNGAVVVLVAILLFFLIAVAAFAIDLGYRHVVRNELQNAADSAALAATRELGYIYAKILSSYEEQQGFYCDRGDTDPDGCARVVTAAINAAYQNYAGDKNNLAVEDTDVLIGRWWTEWQDIDPGSRTDNLTRPDAVMVRTRRDGTSNGPISTFFASIFNIDTMPITAIATASLSGPTTAEPGEIELPIGITRTFFEGHEEEDFCGQTIQFSPTKDSCAGWHTYSDEYSTKTNDPEVGGILDKLADGENPSPYTDTNTNYNYINGDLSEGTFESLMLAFKQRGYDVDSIYDPENPLDIPEEVTSDEDRVPLLDQEGDQLLYPPCSGASGNCTGPPRYAHEWPTTIVVYDSEDCNPNQAVKVWGIANIVVFDVGQPSDKTVKARILCNYVQPGRGGGGTTGTLGDQPNLVE